MMSKNLVKNVFSIAKSTLKTTKKVVDAAIEISGNTSERIAKEMGCSDKTAKKTKMVVRGFTGATLGVTTVAGAMAASVPATLSGGAAITTGLAAITGSMLGGLALGSATTAAGAIYANAKRDVKPFELNEVKVIRLQSKSSNYTIEIRNIKSENIWVFNIYYENGNLMMEGVSIDNSFEGLVKEYYRNGKLRAELWYENNEPVGLIKYYDNDGIENNSIKLDEYKQLFDNEQGICMNDFEEIRN